MDFDLLRDGEQFCNYLDHYRDNGSCLDSIHNLSPDKIFHWNVDSEIQINGDLEVIPVSNNFCDINIKDNTSNASNVNIQQIITGWQQFVDIEHHSNEVVPDDIFSQSDEKDDLLNLTDSKNFDITAYLRDDPSYSTPEKNSRKLRAGVKKIDMKAQRYILDEDDDVDVETVSECDDPSPILEAGDLNSLLEQFEASEVPDLTLPEDFLEDRSINADVPNIEKINITPDNLLEQSLIEYKPFVKIKQEYVEDAELLIKQEYIDNERSHKDTKINIKRESGLLEMECEFKAVVESREVKIKKEPPEKQYDITIKSDNLDVLSKDIKQETTKINFKIKKNKDIVQNVTSKVIEVPAHSKPQQISNTSPKPISVNSANLDKNKQIMNALPQELINRIRESGKRKCISVIEPIVPNKKQRSSRTIEPSVPSELNKPSAFIVPNTVQLDHDYCSHSSVHPKNSKMKDSGFESAEEEERTIIEKQPMVKNADGKLMVSLLKVNTIREEKTSMKRKLNLEEYKKRREGVWKSQTSSLSNSPLNSNCTSPLPEDEEIRRKKHQEKLMKMAMEVLRTPVKTDKKNDPPQVVAVPIVAQIPPDMEMKTLVSIGINTEMKRKKNVDPLAPVEQLELIKPVLQKISNRINSNSLITSLIENIPKVINSCSADESKVVPPVLEHGEDKTIVYLPKNRALVQTKDADTQTNISLIQQTKASRYRRRRNSSTSSSSSDDSHCSRNSMKNKRERRRSNASNRSSESLETSRSSRSSTSYSSRSYSRSRSRSTSPGFSTRKERERERLREVEERRVIYVGRLTNSTTRESLRKRFQRFGSITNISLHSRQHGDKYGFVTFANKLDAYEAIEHGNDEPYYPKYDLSFGGRRIFCQTSYSDLDNVRDEMGYYSAARTTEDSFDNLLKELQEKLRKRKV